MVTMRPPVLAGIIALAALLGVASFRGGQVAERRAQQQSNIRTNQRTSAIPAKKQNRLISDKSVTNDHVLIANVATVSFGELWDVMRTASVEKRASWARELEQMPPGTRRNAAIKSFYKIW